MANKTFTDLEKSYLVELVDIIEETRFRVGLSDLEFENDQLIKDRIKQDEWSKLSDEQCMIMSEWIHFCFEKSGFIEEPLAKLYRRWTGKKLEARPNILAAFLPGSGKLELKDFGNLTDVMFFVALTLLFVFGLVYQYQYDKDNFLNRLEKDRIVRQTIWND